MAGHDTGVLFVLLMSRVGVACWVGFTSIVTVAISRGLILKPFHTTVVSAFRMEEVGVRSRYAVVIGVGVMVGMGICVRVGVGMSVCVGVGVCVGVDVGQISDVSIGVCAEPPTWPEFSGQGVFVGVGVGVDVPGVGVNGRLTSMPNGPLGANLDFCVAYSSLSGSLTLRTQK